ncbi:hypothetical protein C2846_03560 [Pseudomonas jilinensis]|nr:hypothetical protein C2846_03560 [Pseudomonas jilinensis]
MQAGIQQGACQFSINGQEIRLRPLESGGWLLLVGDFRTALRGVMHMDVHRAGALGLNVVHWYVPLVGLLLDCFRPLVFAMT